MADAKHCAFCDVLLERRPRDSQKQWDERRYCSWTCAGAGSRKPRQHCACGCGKQVEGVRSRYRQGHNARVGRSGAPPPRDGVYRLGSFNGKLRWYRNVKVAGRGYKVLRARDVMEGVLGRELAPGEVVHHLNRDSTDDRRENLAVYASHSAHLWDHIKRGDVAVFPSHK